jgi:hypothetical protein
VREANERAAAGGASSGFGRFLVLPFGVRRRRGNANGATPADLKPGTRVVLAGLNAAAMNGSWGTVAGTRVARFPNPSLPYVRTRRNETLTTFFYLS